ncbi:ATP-dependent helicase [Gemmatimonadota bacterium]
MNGSGNIAGSEAYLLALNPEQREAAEHFEGPLLVLAGAGSGKTRVLTTRVCHLIRNHGVPPDRILAVTFTNKAAGEMRDRITSMLGAEPAGMWMGTFHALGARILRRHAPILGWTHAYTIYDEDASLRHLKRAIEKVELDPKRWHPKAVKAEISGAKNQLIGPDEYLEEHGDTFDLFIRNVAKVYPVYQEGLKAQNAFDFDDLLVKPVELFLQHSSVLDRYRQRFVFLLVDEYQDTNHAQFRFLELLSSEHKNLMVVGDDDQSIYGWRGADIRNILDFERTFPRTSVVRLEQNYRSTETILEVANQVISQNQRRKGKTLRTDRTGGERITLVETADESDEARWIVEEIQARMEEDAEASYRSFTILYRTNAQSRALEDSFRRAAVPYQIVGGVRFYERREIQDVLGYLRLISNPLDAGAFQRVVNYPRRGVGGVTLERLTTWAAGEGLSLLEASARAEEIGGLPGAGGTSLVEFARLIQRYSGLATRLPVGELVGELVRELNLLHLLREEGPDGEDRAGNVEELIAGAMDFDAEIQEEWEEEVDDPFTELDLFLQRVALVADIDQHDPDADTVSLMTLHNAKGLEFPVVIISGLEEGLFPLSRSYEDPDSLEEERRLFYVGITRAERKLYMSYARRRRRGGEYMFGRLSTFVDPIHTEHLEERRSPRLERDRSLLGYGSRRTGWDDLSDDLADDQDAGFDELNQDSPRFVKGERVLHPTFGSGSVHEISGFGRDVKVTVDFDSVGRKKLLVRYAGLERDFE